MVGYVRVALTAAIAASALAIATSSALGSRAIEIGASTRATTSVGALSFGDGTLTNQIVCNVTFLRELERTISKAIGGRWGAVTGMAIERPEGCRIVGGLFIRANFIVALRVTAPELPTSCRELGEGVRLCDVSGALPSWGYEYTSFTGTLPNFTAFSLRIRSMRFKIEFSAFGAPQTCLYEVNLATVVRITERRARTLEIDLRSTRPGLVTALRGILCNEVRTLGGSFRLTPEPTIALV